MTENQSKSLNVQVDAIKEFIDGFAKLNNENQLVLLGMLKGMVAVNEINEIQKEA